MSDWTSKYAIMRDLAVAQGFDVPVDLEGIGANEKPPALNILEDNGEDYFGQCDGEGDLTCPPDLALIQHMLDMVRDVGISNDEDTIEQVVQISKPSSLSIGKDITNINTGTIPKTFQRNIKTQAKKLRKKRENVAVNSILLAMSKDIPITNMEAPKEPLKLLKPTDFMSETESEIVQSVEKVNGWLDAQVPSTSMSKFSGNPLLLEPGSMFKRKSNSTNKSQGSNSIKSSPQKQADLTISPCKPAILSEDTQECSISRKGYPLSLDAGSMFKRKNGSTIKSPPSGNVKSPSPQQASSTIGSYKPSILAGEYYQKYVERSKMKELVQDDVWTRAERIMKELDARKKLEAEAAAEIVLVESTTDVTAIDTTVLDANTIDGVAIEINTVDGVAKEEIADDGETIDTIDNGIKSMAEEVKVPEMLEFLRNVQSNLRPIQDSSFTGRELIELPQHRHLLTGECVVCEVVKSRGFDVDKEIYGSLK